MIIDVDLIQYRRQILTDNATGPEITFSGLLKKYGIEFEFQYPVCIGRQDYYLDFYLPKYKSYIELDGKHHRTDAKQMWHDRARSAAIFKEYGFKEVRLSNRSALKITRSRLIEKITGGKKVVRNATQGMTLAQKVEAKKAEKRKKKKNNQYK